TLFGAAYLVYLGIRSLVAACRRSPFADIASVRVAKAPLPRFAALRQGVINNLANPKMAMFFASVFPQFAPRSDAALVTLLLLGVLFSVLTCLWLSIYAALIARASRLLGGSRIGRAVDGIAGVTLIGLGLRVATEQR